MQSGASRQKATKIVAGVISAAAVRPSPRRFSATGPCGEGNVGHVMPLNDLFHHSWNAASFLAM